MKTPNDSYTESSFLARPGNANTIGTVFGGDIMQMMDEAAAICARRHSGLRVVTITVDKVRFLHAILVGHVIKISAIVTRVFTTSMEVEINVWAEDTYKQESIHAAQAFFSIVCTDEHRQPVPIQDLEPQTHEDKLRWEQAGIRRNKKKKNTRI